MCLMQVVGPSVIIRWNDFLAYKGPENFQKSSVSLCGSAEPKCLLPLTAFIIEVHQAVDPRQIRDLHFNGFDFTKFKAGIKNSKACIPSQFEQALSSLQSTDRLLKRYPLEFWSVSR